MNPSAACLWHYALVASGPRKPAAWRVLLDSAAKQAMLMPLCVPPIAAIWLSGKQE
jgi:hypothetical protein